MGPGPPSSRPSRPPGRAGSRRPSASRSTTSAWPRRSLASRRSSPGSGSSSTAPSARRRRTRTATTSAGRAWRRHSGRASSGSRDPSAPARCWRACAGAPPPPSPARSRSPRRASRPASSSGCATASTGELAADFTTAGASHVVAISGWNIAIVAASIGALGGRLARRRRSLITLAAITGYVVFVGHVAIGRAGCRDGRRRAARPRVRAGGPGGGGTRLGRRPAADRRSGARPRRGVPALDPRDRRADRLGDADPGPAGAAGTRAAAQLVDRRARRLARRPGRDAARGAPVVRAAVARRAGGQPRGRAAGRAGDGRGRHRPRRGRGGRHPGSAAGGGDRRRPPGLGAAEPDRLDRARVRGAAAGEPCARAAGRRRGGDRGDRPARRGGYAHRPGDRRASPDAGHDGLEARPGARRRANRRARGGSTLGRHARGARRPRRRCRPGRPRRRPSARRADDGRRPRRGPGRRDPHRGLAGRPDPDRRRPGPGSAARGPRRAAPAVGSAARRARPDPSARGPRRGTRAAPRALPGRARPRARDARAGARLCGMGPGACRDRHPCGPPGDGQPPHRRRRPPDRPLAGPRIRAPRATRHRHGDQQRLDRPARRGRRAAVPVDRRRRGGRRPDASRPRPAAGRRPEGRPPRERDGDDRGLPRRRPAEGGGRLRGRGQPVRAPEPGDDRAARGSRRQRIPDRPRRHRRDRDRRWEGQRAHSRGPTAPGREPHNATRRPCRSGVPLRDPARSRRRASARARSRPGRPVPSAG